MTKTASHDDLSVLHSELAAELARRIRGIPETDKETGAVSIRMASAAELSVARGLLKDNAITAPPGASQELNELEQALAERRARRAKVTPAELEIVNRA